ncbi:MAG: hypothetical protein R2792_03550 [Saprospiraceae bacterium]
MLDLYVGQRRNTAKYPRQNQLFHFARQENGIPRMLMKPFITDWT